jgi:hypothetical protein
MEENTMKEVQERLQALRPVLLGERGHSFLDLFDEFMQQREFGFALHTLCDFILDPDSPQVSKSILDQIQRLHALMKIDDHCLEEIETRGLT